MYYYGARYYDPRISIFVSVDPAAVEYPNIGGYVYVANNPIIFVDPDGRRIRGVKMVNGEITYTKRAIRNGTQRYIEARMKTKSGTESIMNMIGAKKKYSLLTTDKVFVLPTENGKYAVTAGVTDHDSGTILISTNKNGYDSVTDDQLKNAVTLDQWGDLIDVNTITKINRQDLDNPIGDKGEYNRAYNDTGMKEFEQQYPYQSETERIHGIGAHEENHLFNPQNAGKVYEDETKAFEAEKKARIDYRNENK